MTEPTAPHGDSPDQTRPHLLPDQPDDQPMGKTHVNLLTPPHTRVGSHESTPRVAATWRSRWVDAEVPTRDRRPAVMSASSRLRVALSGLAVLTAGLVAWAAGYPGWAAALLILFLVGGVGAAVCLTAGRMTAASFVVYAGVSGLASTTAIGFGMAQAGWWYPGTALGVVAVISVTLLVRSARRDVKVLRERAPVGGAPRSGARGLAASLRVAAIALGGLLLAVVDAATRATEPQLGGLIFTVGPLWYLGCALIAVAFGYALTARASLAAPVLAAGTVVIASQAVLYGSPTVMAAARHIGLTEYIRSTGSLDATQDIYQAWPGLFAGAAWLLDATGAASPLVFATWWPVLITPLTVLAVWLLAVRFVSPTRAWVAAGIYALGDAVNSTYFSPQAFGFLLSMTVLALLVRPPAAESGRRRALRLVFAFALVLPVVVTHQISPFMLGFALLALVLFRLVQPWWTPLIAFVPAVIWALLHHRLLARYVDLDALGSLFGNIAPPEHPEAVAGIAPVTRLAFYVPGAALVLLGLVALAVVARRRDRLHVGLAAALASPLGLALATNYGQEGIFRIVLFAVPWLGILVASAQLPSRRSSVAALTAGFLVMMAVNTYGQSGLDWARILRPGDAEVIAHFERTASDKATLLSLGTKNATPTRITERYDSVGYTSRLRVGGFPVETGGAYDPQVDVDYVTDTFTGTRAPGGHYLYVSDAIGAYDDRYGLQRYDDYLRLEQAVAVSPRWAQVYATPTATLYKLRTEPLGSDG